ncbi:MAG: hypothetical protein R3228_09645 [Halioglobus sp.]|nr:hypothetical protein [Halioglobus sp.]
MRILVTAGVSVAIGALALVTVLYWYYPGSGFVQGNDINLDSVPAVNLYEAADSRSGVDLQASGGAVVVFPIADFKAGDYPFFKLELSDYSVVTGVHLLWSNRAGATKPSVNRLPGIPFGAAWIFNASLPEWSGNIREFGVLIEGYPGARVDIVSAELLPWSARHLVQSIWASWRSFDIWQLSSVNFYTGAESVRSPFPQVPIMATWVGLSAIAYLLLHAVSRTTSRTAWLGAGYMVLAGWLCIDLLWQRNLFIQAMDTRAPHDKKTWQARRNIDADAALQDLAEALVEIIGPESTRVFVNSDDEYRAMRSAYYLYPRNVYWHRKQAGQLPGGQMRRGDHVVLVQPTSIVFSSASGQLETQGGQRIDAKLVWQSADGSLYEVL